MFDTVAIEPQGRIQDSMLGGGGGGGGQYLNMKYFHASAEDAKPCKGVGGSL